MKAFNVGIIGYGWVSGAHIAAINATSRAQVTDVYSSRELNPADVSARHGHAIRCHRNLDDLLGRPDVHAVSICSYPQQHAAQAIAAARAGKHLIIEKPLALQWEDCERIEEAVRTAGVRCCVGFECRFSSQFLATKAVLDNGWLGTVHYGEVDYYHGIGPWYGQYRWNRMREGGGSSLLSAGCHALDALLLCMGDEVTEVTSYSAQSANPVFQAYEYPTTSVTLVKFAGGRVGKVASVIDCRQPYYFHTHLVGSEGSLLDDQFHSTRVAGLNGAAWSRLSMKLLDSGDVSDHPYQTQFEAFFEALEADREMPLTSLAEAMKSHRVIFAADRSAAENRPVSLES